jgi:3-oxoadipate enol-lactonase
MTMPASNGRLVNVGGQALFTVVDGPVGAPWLVFSNSLATDLHLWDAQVETLANDWRILRYDYRGHGKSEASISSLCTIEELKNDLFKVMDYASVMQAHHIGVSMGSVAGAAAALEQPRRFASLTICNCRLKSSSSAANDLNARAERALVDGMKALVEPTLAKWFGSSRLPLDDVTRGKVAFMIAATRAPDFAAYAKGLRGYDVEQVLKQPLAPMSIITGSDDGEIAPYLRSLCQNRSDLTFSTIEGAGHLPNIHAPGEFMNALTSFLGSLK